MFYLPAVTATNASDPKCREFSGRSRGESPGWFHVRNPAFCLCLAVLACGCGNPAMTTDAADESGSEFGVLLFGDSGYHLDYPDEDDHVDVFTADQFVDKEYEDWIEDKRPVEEFAAQPGVVSPVTGGVVAATGMHRISAAMKNYCADTAVCDFGAMLGDNIYPDGATLGADGQDDAVRFEKILGDPFGNLVEHPEHYVTYVTLGNHDWNTSRAGGFAQIEYLTNRDGFYIDGPFYSVQPPALAGIVELFVIDTNMMLATRPVRKDRLNDDGSEASTDEIDEPGYSVEPLTDDERNMHIWLESALRSSAARWKLVVGHHPIWSSAGSKFEQARTLRRAILPLLCRHADAYLAGHEHTLEIHTDDCSVALGTPTEKPLVQIVSGAAAKQRPIHSSFMRHQERKYPEHSTIWARGLLWGFAHLRVAGDRAVVSLLSIPDHGPADVAIEFEYEFERRSHIAADHS